MQKVTASSPATAELGSVTLRHASPLTLQLSTDGVPSALRHDAILINQLIPDPYAEGLFRLFMRERRGEAVLTARSLVKPGAAFGTEGGDAAAWQTDEDELTAVAQVQLHPREAAWAWTVEVTNRSERVRTVDFQFAQDLGLADEAAVRGNEAFTSHYIDLNPVEDEDLGWLILARQNQAASEGRHPLLLAACLEGATAFCTDGWQFFGADHRFTSVPKAVMEASLPSEKLQYECAMACLQSAPLEIEPGQSRRITFLLRFLPDHPEASSAEDVRYLRALLPTDWVRPLVAEDLPAPDLPPSLFQRAPWLHGGELSEAEWGQWFPGERRHEERDTKGRLLSFFQDGATHVVARAKEATILRPHGHILRSGDYTRVDPGHMGLTCYAAGIFGAQSYLGNTNLARLLPVVRNALGVTRSSGQRIFVEIDGVWLQLGIPSAFTITPGEVRWLYRLEGLTIEVQAACSEYLPASFLRIRVRQGDPCRLLVSHRVMAGDSEGDTAATVEFEPEQGMAMVVPSGESLFAQQEPDTLFGLGFGDPGTLDALEGTAGIQPGANQGNAAYVVFRSLPTRRCDVVLAGVREGEEALREVIHEARTALAGDVVPAAPPPVPLHLYGGEDAGVGRVDEILPWYHHNASIHFSAPHGLEQYGGAAWGVRDVCQGSLEWLLAVDRLDVARAVLRTVFGQQYAREGGWPQWFMHAPFQFIQQHESHGDVCFWPVKALCDYLARSNDLSLLDERVEYTEPGTFRQVGPAETILRHCDRVIALLESRLVGDTALVNYGDGDWDDTLQPADPKLRTRMISAWTVGLAYHTLRLFREVCARREDAGRVAQLDDLLARMRRDFHAQLVVDDVVAGFLIRDEDGDKLLLHPNDSSTGIRYRLLPMTRSILAELFEPEEAARHLEIVRREMLFDDGVRLMSEPVRYRGGVEHYFKRAETAANIGREVGLMYVHAHIRYAEALAKVGDAEGFWRALQLVNPVGLQAILPQAVARQANVFFSSSDADFADREDASARWDELRAGKVAVRGGWRLYSSGPGLFLNLVKSCLLGVRPSFGDVVLDPVLPPSLDGLVAEVRLFDHPVSITYRVRGRGFGPEAVQINGTRLAPSRREENPYRTGGLILEASEVTPLLVPDQNRITIEV